MIPHPRRGCGRFRLPPRRSPLDAGLDPARGRPIGRPARRKAPPRAGHNRADRRKPAAPPRQVALRRCAAVWSIAPGSAAANASPGAPASSDSGPPPRGPPCRRPARCRRERGCAARGGESYRPLAGPHGRGAEGGPLAHLQLHARQKTTASTTARPVRMNRMRRRGSTRPRADVSSRCNCHMT